MNNAQKNSAIHAMRVQRCAPVLLKCLKSTLYLAELKWADTDPEVTKYLDEAQAAINEAEGRS